MVVAAQAAGRAVVLAVVLAVRRLRQPRISTEEEARDVITLRFELSGQVAATQEGGQSTQPFAMIIRVNSSGRVFVEPKAAR